MQVLPLLDLLAEVLAGVECGHHIGGQPAVARPVLADHDRGLFHGGVGTQYGLDLAGFDAEAADLHL